MKALVFSNSDAVGAFTGGVGWASLLSQGGDIEVVAAPFFPGAASAAGYVARKVGQEAPDAVVVPFGTYGFTISYVQYRIDHLLGRRIGAGYRRLERAFDIRTRKAGSPPSGFNAFARKVLRRTVGAEPAISQADMTAYCRATLDALSQFEDTAVVVVTAYPAYGTHLAVALERRRQQFFAELTSFAAKHHFVVVRVDAALDGPPLDELMLDDIHLSAEGHPLLAAAVRRALLRSDEGTRSE